MPVTRSRILTGSSRLWSRGELPSSRPARLEGTAAMWGWFNHVFANFRVEGFGLQPGAVEEHSDVVIKHGDWKGIFQPKDGSPGLPAAEPISRDTRASRTAASVSSATHSTECLDECESGWRVRVVNHGKVHCCGSISRVSFKIFGAYRGLGLYARSFWPRAFQHKNGRLPILLRCNRFQLVASQIQLLNLPISRH